MVPWRNRAGPSTATAPIAAMWAFFVAYPSAASPTTAANAAAIATIVRNTWVV